MKVSELAQDRKNANKGTKRGRDLVRESLQRFGAGRSVLIDKDGKLIAGNKTAAQAAAAGIEEVIVVKTDGTKLVAVQRTDLSLDDQTAQELAIADNRVAQIGLEWDKDVMAELVGVGDMDLKPFFSDDELADLLEAKVPAEPKDLSDKVVTDGFGIVIEDLTECQQIELLDRLAGEGYKVRGLVA